MKTFYVEYEVFPTRGIFNALVEATDIEVAKAKFKENSPSANIRRIVEVPANIAPGSPPETSS